MKRTDERLLIAVLAILVAGGVMYFFLRPMITDYRENRLALAARTIEVSDLTERKALLTRLSGDVDSSQGVLDKLFVAVPDDDKQTAEIIAQLADMTQATGLRIVSIQPVQTGRRRTVASQSTISLTVEGGYAEIVALAELLEKNLRPATVSSATLARTGEVADSGELSATFQIAFLRAAAVTEGAQ